MALLRILLLITLPAAVADAHTHERIALRGVNILSFENAQPARFDHTIVIEDQTIVEVLPTDQFSRDEITRVYRLDNKWVIPGLIDMQLNTAEPTDLIMAVTYGVTSARISSDSERIECTQAQIRNDTVAGPMLYSAETLASSDDRTWLIPSLAGEFSSSRLDEKSKNERSALVSPRVRTARSNSGEDANRPTSIQKCLQQKGYPSGGNIKLLTGSNAPTPFVPPGLGVHDELRLLVEAGLTRREALAAATRNGATALGRGETIGTISEGARADLVVLKRNPLEDISATTDIHAVVLRGRYLHQSWVESKREWISRRYADAEDPWGELGNTFDTAQEWDTPLFQAEYVCLFDGMPCGATRLLIAEDESKPRAVLEKSMWPPQDSTLRTCTRFDDQWRLREADLAYRSEAQSFQADFSRLNQQVKVHLDVKGVRPSRDAFALIDDEVMVVDLLPGIAAARTTLTDLAVEETTVLPGHELVYGDGPIYIAKFKLKVTRIPKSTLELCDETIRFAYKLETVQADTPYRGMLGLNKDGWPILLRLHFDWGVMTTRRNSPRNPPPWPSNLNSEPQTPKPSTP